MFKLIRKTATLEECVPHSQIDGTTQNYFTPLGFTVPDTTELLIISRPGLLDSEDATPLLHPFWILIDRSGKSFSSLQKKGHKSVSTR
jgi:hypothetical protein